jgi:hypothetical protein
VEQKDHYTDTDFEYVYVDELRPGMIINLTTVKGADAENFLVWTVSIQRSGVQVKGYFTVLTDEGLPQDIHVGTPISPYDTETRIRVVGRRSER